MDRWLTNTVANASRAEKDRFRAGTIVLDPPRAGAGRDVVVQIAALQPEQVVYVACDPVALARDVATFAAYRRAAERPEFVVEKRPALRARQGEWALIGEHGQVLKRGHELASVLAPLERRLLRLVEE